MSHDAIHETTQTSAEGTYVRCSLSDQAIQNTADMVPQHH